jgi:quaternary ammonium compound-resistance protein SugE
MRQWAMQNSSWLLLILAGACEIGWVVGIKYSAGFTRLWPSAWTVAMLALSMILLAYAVRTLPIGTAYAVWTGVGAAGSAVLGIWLFNEPATALRILCITLIVTGVAGLRFATAP